MNLYDKASLILTPNAYKASKMYAVKPTDGSGDFTFTRASTAMRRNSSGIWESVANNVPRLHYPVGGGCPGFLIEDQRTNDLTKSVDLTNAAWTVIGASVAGTANPSPISGVNFTRFTINTSAGIDRIFRSTVIAAGQTRTISVFLKSDTYSGVVILRGDASGNSANASLNLATNVITNSGANVIRSRVFPESNGVRLELTFTTVVNPNIDLITSSPGVSGVSFLFTQIQLENYTYASSPIVTDTATATRAADVPISGSINSLLGTQNTFYIEFTPTRAARACLFELNVGGNATSNSIYVGIESNNLMFLFANKAGANIHATNIGSTPYLLNTLNKFAIRFNGNNYSCYLNGVLIATITSSDFPIGLSRIDYGQARLLSGYWLNGCVGGTMLIIPQSLINAEMVALTTL